MFSAVFIVALWLGGSESPKLFWRNIWMVPNTQLGFPWSAVQFLKSSFCIVESIFSNFWSEHSFHCLEVYWMNAFYISIEVCCFKNTLKLPTWHVLNVTYITCQCHYFLQITCFMVINSKEGFNYHEVGYFFCFCSDVDDISSKSDDVILMCFTQLGVLDKVPTFPWSNVQFLKSALL